MATATYIIHRLQEINRSLLPDFPGRTPNADSIGTARTQIRQLIDDLTSKPKVIRNREAGTLPTLIALSLFGGMIFVFVAAMA